MEKREPTLLHCWLECKLVEPLWRTVWRFLRKTGNRTALWPSNPTAGHTHRGNQNWKRHVYPNVHQFKFHISSVQSLSHVRLFVTPWIAALRPPCPSPTPGVHSDSRPSSRWCRPAISSSVNPFSSCPQSLPASESFPMSQLFAWGGQSTRVSALASVLPKNTQDWSLEWTGWISLQEVTK